MNKPQILFVEDDTAVGNLIATTLETQNYQFHRAKTGAGALMDALSYRPDVMLLDLGLPDMDGIEIIKKIRSWSNLPIIVVSARGEDADKVVALDAGADDYLVKPFSIEELLARVRAHLRRVTPAITGEIRVADLIINLEGREVFRGNRRIELSNKEFELLELLAKNPGKVFSRYEIEEKVWPGYQGGSNVVDVYIGYLRKKLEAGGERRLIHTVRGVGYVLRED